MSSRHFAIVLGVVYTIVGVLGLLPGMLASPPPGAPPLRVDEGYGYLFGLFPVNLLHTLVHLGVGVWGLVASRRLGASRDFARSVAVIFGVLTVLGLIPGLNTVFGLVPLFGHDVWLHAATAIAAAYFGFGRSRMADVLQDEQRRRAA
jgi:hypothetical protein